MSLKSYSSILTHPLFLFLPHLIFLEEKPGHLSYWPSYIPDLADCFLVLSPTITLLLYSYIFDKLIVSCRSLIRFLFNFLLLFDRTTSVLLLYHLVKPMTDCHTFSDTKMISVFGGIGLTAPLWSSSSGFHKKALTFFDDHCTDPLFYRDLHLPARILKRKTQSSIWSTANRIHKENIGSMLESLSQQLTIMTNMFFLNIIIHWWVKE